MSQKEQTSATPVGFVFKREPPPNGISLKADWRFFGTFKMLGNQFSYPFGEAVRPSMQCDMRRDLLKPHSKYKC